MNLLIATVCFHTVYTHDIRNISIDLPEQNFYFLPTSTMPLKKSVKHLLLLSTSANLYVLPPTSIDFPRLHKSLPALYKDLLACMTICVPDRLCTSSADLHLITFRIQYFNPPPHISTDFRELPSTLASALIYFHHVRVFPPTFTHFTHQYYPLPYAWPDPNPQPVASFYPASNTFGGIILSLLSRPKLTPNPT